MSDASTDRTDELVAAWARRHDFIRLHRICHPHARGCPGQVGALAAGLALIAHVNFDYVGNLDADISLPPGYYKELMAKFQRDPTLGLASGFAFKGWYIKRWQRFTVRLRQVEDPTGPK